ncbi:MAG: transposase [Desulfobacterales bacterium]|nr:transposase [Desulfobacterales bacterium]
MVFVRHRSKKGWLAILSTDISLPEEEVVRTYGKRWDIEVFFKMAKQHLRMDSEIQSRRFDALVAHVSIVFLRYLFISWRMRMKEDQRSFGEVFRATLPEIRDVTLLEALKRIAAILFEIATAKAKDGYVLVESLLEIFEQSIQLFFQIPPDSKLALVDS